MRTSLRTVLVVLSERTPEEWRKKLIVEEVNKKKDNSNQNMWRYKSVMKCVSYRMTYVK